jgi:hypothetical protein
VPTITLPPDMPSPMRQLPRDEVGRPIPYFAAEVAGVHDFRLMDGRKLVKAVLDQLCWICGTRLNRAHRGSDVPRGTFVAGPMCLINRTSAEPPNHAACAEWSAKACPFLAKPAKDRRTGNLPETVEEMPGIAILRNPGVTALIDSERWEFYRVGHNDYGAQDGLLCNFSRVTSVRWMAEGQNASQEQVLEAIETGLPALVEMARMENGAMRVLAIKTRDAMRWVGQVDTVAFPTIGRVLAELP